MDEMKWTALEAGRRIRAHEIGVEELTKACLDEIKKTNDTYHSFITICEQEAMAQAKKYKKALMMVR